jgi:hypothetical protein
MAMRKNRTKTTGQRPSKQALLLLRVSTPRKHSRRRPVKGQ